MKRWQWIPLLIVFLGTVVAAFLDRTGGTPAFFYAFFGFFGCLLLLFLTKVVGKKVLMKKEDYYDAS